MLTGEQIMAAARQLRPVALRLTGMCHAHADDLLSEAVARAWRHRGQFRGENHVAWMRTILVNVHRSQFRREQIAPFVSLDEIDLAAVEPQASDDPTASVGAQHLVSAIARLPKPFRAVISRIACGLAYEEVAEDLEIPLGTVRSRVFRARERLAEHAF